MGNPEQLKIIKRGSDAWNEWRKEHPGEKIDLSEEMIFGGFSGLDLRGVDLRDANLLLASLPQVLLSGATLINANLAGASLEEADLRNADLSEADLRNADLSEADLRNADLSRARLHSTNFTNALLDKTNFTQATFGRTILGDVDLSSATGLEAARHSGPSVIGIDTLYRSKGKIPDVFLRGVGVPESFIEYIPSLIVQPKGFIEYIPSLIVQPLQFYSCFISYSHADKVFARHLHDNLKARGISCWLDEKQLLPGQEILDEVDRGIGLWDKVLLCCSESSLRSWWVDKEINRAFIKEQELQKKRGKKVLALIPLDLDGYLFTEWDDGKAAVVKARLAADFKGWKDDNAKFEEQFERVVKALQTDDGREAPPPPRL